MTHFNLQRAWKANLDISGYMHNFHNFIIGLVVFLLILDFTFNGRESTDIGRSSHVLSLDQNLRLHSLPSCTFWPAGKEAEAEESWLLNGDVHLLTLAKKVALTNEPCVRPL